MKNTPLHELHLELGGKMVPFAGYEMPVQYSQGIKQEHLHTRSQAGLFDISHMGQLMIRGEGAAEWLESLVPGDIKGLEVNRQRYTVLTNESGGIIDDLMITKMEDGYFLVINAACKDKDVAHLQNLLPEGLSIKLMGASALLALQGPDAAKVLSEYEPAINDLRFLQAGRFSISGLQCLIHRCGYTGEDGFEISLPSQSAEELARDLLSHDSVNAIGLGARDSLRLEAGLCLYGHDMDDHTSPIEAGLSWTIARKYRDGEYANFPGAEIILEQLKTGVNITRKGFKIAGKMPIREGVEILNDNNESVGKITSGGYGPSVGGPVAMGYIQSECNNSETALHVLVRGRNHDISIEKLPFVEHRYYKTRS
jgi:aminomethyltransferase